MKPNDIKTLKILEALEKDPAQTQRDLANQLKISLGLVNAFTKRLAQKGCFKISTIPKRRIQYMLTPKGLAEKARLTYQYVSFSLQYYAETRSKIKGVLRKLPEQQNTLIYFFGVSELAEIAYISLQETRLTLAGIIDDELAGNSFLGFQVKDKSFLKKISKKDIIVITEIKRSDINDLLYSKGFTENRIIDLARL